VKKFFVRFLMNWDVETRCFPFERSFTIDLDFCVAKQGTKCIVTKEAVGNKPYKHHKCCPKCETTTDLAQKLGKLLRIYGQLYVAMSRIECPEGVKVLVTDGWENVHEDAPAGVYTRNVVYTEVL